MSISILNSGVTPAELLRMQDGDRFELHVYHQDGSTNWLRESDQLTGDGALKGFSVPIRELFPPQPPHISLLPNAPKD